MSSPEDIGTDAERPRLRVLIVDDDATNRLLIRSIVTREGHDSVLATNGKEAIEAFVIERPDLILMDVHMPTMGGHEAARQIKSRAGEIFTPIIFLTGDEGPEALTACVEAGGDDFMSKPVNPLVLRAKMHALERIRRLNTAVFEQKSILHQHAEETRAEMKAAEEIFNRITNQGSLRSGLYRFRLSPTSLFNGDIAVACSTRSGGQRILLGDFTGHGLPAAVGAIPLTDIFYSMTAKGCSISDLILESNRKLMQILPTGMFCGVIVIDIDPVNRTLAIWNGGMPELLLCSARGQVLREFASQHLALGVHAARPGYSDPVVEPLLEKSRLYCFTDGLTEAKNHEGEEFGLDRVKSALVSAESFECVLSDLHAFVGDRALDDDVALLEIDTDLILQELGPISDQELVVNCDRERRVAEWEITSTFKISALRQHDPVPILMHAVAEMGLPEGLRGNLFTILSELTVNSIDHGLLELDSTLKADASGFARYFLEREQRLENYEVGELRVTLRCEAASDGGDLLVIVEDSGKGFEVELVMAKIGARGSDAPALHGRGLVLLNHLCDSVEFFEGGRRAEARMRWSCSEPMLA